MAIGIRTTNSNIANLKNKVNPSAHVVLNNSQVTPVAWPGLDSGFISLSNSLIASDFSDPVAEDKAYTVSEGSFGVFSEFPIQAGGCFVSANIVLPNDSEYKWQLKMGFATFNLVGATPSLNFSDAIFSTIGNIPFPEICIYESVSDLEISSVLKSSSIISDIPTNGQATECFFQWDGTNGFKFVVQNQTVIARSGIADNFSSGDYYGIIIFEVG